MKSFWIQLTLVTVVGMLTYNVFSYAEEAEEWMPDETLRAAVREELGLPAAAPLTKDQMQQIVSLYLNDKGISDITGLEFATNITELDISQNPITDLRPLSNLTQLIGLHFWHFPASPTDLDLRPLASLINLEVLSLEGNGISDITPLANLKKLRSLDLVNNRIKNFSPLAGLANLRVLRITKNWARDLSPLAELNLTEFHYDAEVDSGECEIPVMPPVIERIHSKDYPSIYQPWNTVAEIPEEHDLINPWTTPEVYHKRIARNDLYFPHFLEGIKWATYTQPYPGLSTRIGGNLAKARAEREMQLAYNPNLVFLVEVRVHNFIGLEDLPLDSDVWLRDTDGQVVRRPVSWDEFMLNILRPEVQQLLIDRIVGIAECGLFDGVFLDNFRNNATGQWDDFYEELSTFAGRKITDEDIIEIYRHILGSVRERVRPDFLIFVNANVTRPEKFTEFINGSHMETEPRFIETRDGLRQIEDVLFWNEENLRTPRINGLEVAGVDSSVEFDLTTDYKGPPKSPEHQRRMRLTTTLSLTHSDGYVKYTIHAKNHQRYAPWYIFWEAPLGYPVGEKRQLYENREGLFIREFTNGWVVYNRSGKAQDIQMPETVSGWASGVKNRHRHTVPDLDGEIYLKQETGLPADVNGDGVVNIQDLVIVANAFGEAEPDVNGDGVVNIQDLVIVANAF